LEKDCAIATVDNKRKEKIKTMCFNKWQFDYAIKVSVKKETEKMEKKCRVEANRRE
jgi:hypothetical protein